jgi:photosynthetic reaction center cytochrome c subunit
MSFGLKIVGALAVVAGAFVASHFTLPPVVSQQRGYRGHGDEILYLPKTLAKLRADNVSPAPEPAQDPAGQPASQVYQNLKVLGKIDANEFLRLMASIANWVAPVQGCTYCHNQENLAYDSIYTKIVARRMLQMTEHINKDWKAHVGATGVTCYTCHRGQPVPTYVWFNAPPPAPNTIGGFAETNQGKNLVSKVAVGSALPYDPGAAGAGAARHRQRVDQRRRLDLCADDAVLQRAGRELQLLPCHPRVPGLGPVAAAACHRLVWHSHGA